MQLSIIIINYNATSALKNSLSWLKNNLKNHAQIIVVDNGSAKKGLSNLKREFDFIELVRLPKNVGFAKAANTGLKRAQGKYIFLTHAGVFFLKNEFPKMIDYLETHPQVGLLGPRLIIDGKGTIQDSCRRYPTFLIPLYRRFPLKYLSKARKEVNRYLMNDFNHKEIKNVDWLVSSALLIRKKALKEVGLMDERFFLYCEDIDWSKRFWQKGWYVIYFPHATLFHDYQRPSAQKGFSWYKIYNKGHHLISWFKYFLKHYA